MKDTYSRFYLWYVVAILTLASTFSIIDRQILNIMIGPVKRDLGGISDFQVSLIMGFAFTFLYSVLSYPAGRIADRYSRKNLMVAGIASWSLLTMVCGLAHQYWHLFLARMGVGVGEATLGPAANSALADYFDASRLPLMIGIVSSAPFIGQGLANIAGGTLIDYLEATPNFVWPIVGELYSWQMVFIVVGAPGLLIALAMWFLQEPARRGKMRDTQDSVPFREVWAFVLERKKFFALVFLGYLCLATQGWSLFSWLVEYYVRNHDWTRSEIGLVYGSIALGVGIAGSVIGGLWAGWLISKNVVDGTLRVVMYGTIVLLPTAGLLTVVSDPWLGIILLIPVTFCMAMPPGLMMATLQAIAPNELRGQMVAFYLIAVNFLAYTFAPTLPAMMSDFIFADELALGKSISILAVFNYSLAAICFYFGLRQYRLAIEAAQAWRVPIK
ncbi:MAG: MFS transporter [Gammaproteobacteria bacterium]|jgi:MFS family permease|nr:MFS transporter [Gammaproteobacteria bacterium]